MIEEREILFADLEQAAAVRSPELGALIVRFLEQDDPVEEDGVWGMSKLKESLSEWSLRGKTASERKAARRESWASLLGAPNPSPRALVSRLLLQLYEAGDEPARSALIEVFSRGRMIWGPWQAFKKIYKLSETRHDLPIFSVLAYRFDAASPSEGEGEIARGTFVYLRRRAWRWLRQLGRALPEIYPQFAAQILAQYPANFSFSSSWVASQIWGHGDLIGRSKSHLSGPPKDLSKRAFPEAWKISADPLLRLLEEAQHDRVAEFAIASLEKDFPEALRSADPQWLSRLGARQIPSIDSFVVKLLSESPDFHPSKLRDLGLHELMLRLVTSGSAAARKYALEYARSQAPDVPVAELIRWLDEGEDEAAKLAASRLEKLSGRAIGLPALIELLRFDTTSVLAAQKIHETIGPQDLDVELFIRLATGESAQRKLLTEIYERKKQKPPAEWYRTLLEDARCDRSARSAAMRDLDQRYSGEEIGFDFVKKGLASSTLGSTVQGWLRAGRFRAAGQDLEWLKAEIARPALRSLVIEVLAQPNVAKPSEIGLGWLLQLLRHPDEALQTFAHRYLSEHFAPEDFGADRLWGLIVDPSEPVRRFAAEYLVAHHKKTGPYPLARVRPLFFDERADVRSFAAAIGGLEIVRWNDRKLLYRLAEAPHKETRRFAAEVLLAIGESGADAPPVEWLDANEIFALTENTAKPSRELALSLIRRQYDRLGGPARLGWLMESPDREVRLFAVRLLWEKHRSEPLPLAETDSSLTHFLRATLFGLPPGRMEKKEGKLPERAIPASVAKQRLVEVVRDMAIEDRRFADRAVPVLRAFTQSAAKGEWQSCVAALARIQRAHPDIETGLVRAVG